MDTDARITELEIKFTHQQDLLSQLSDVLVEQRKEIDSLKTIVADLQKRAPGEGLAFDPDERPPHY